MDIYIHWKVIICWKSQNKTDSKRQDKTRQDKTREHPHKRLSPSFETWWHHQMETFLCYWPFVQGIHQSPVNSQHKGQWLGALMFSLICSWIKGWVNSCEAGDFRCHHAHYDVTVIEILYWTVVSNWNYSNKVSCIKAGSTLSQPVMSQTRIEQRCVTKLYDQFNCRFCDHLLKHTSQHAWSRLSHMVRCCYNMINFLINLHKRHPLGRGMGCLLWIQHLNDILPEFMQLFM